MKRNSIFTLMLPVLFVSGCATLSECDPSVRKNTATTVGCIFSGHYKTRQLSLEAALEEEKALSESLRQIYALLETEQQGVAGNLTSKQSQYKQLNATMNDLIAKVSANSQGNAALQQKIDKLKNKMSYVNNSTSSAQKQLALSSLSSEVESLKKELGYN